MINEYDKCLMIMNYDINDLKYKIELHYMHLNRSITGDHVVCVYDDQLSTLEIQVLNEGCPSWGLSKGT